MFSYLKTMLNYKNKRDEKNFFVFQMVYKGKEKKLG